MSVECNQPLPIIRVGEIPRKEHAQRWLVEQLWGDSSVGVIGGAPKCSKTWLGLDLALSVATGTACLGKYAVAQPGPVLVYLAEDALPVVRERVEGMAGHRGLDLDAVDVHVITAPVLRLDRDPHRMRLFETAKRLRPRLLLLDPLVRLHGIDENNATEVAGLLAYFRTLQRRLDLSVVPVHHTRKNEAGGVAVGQGLRGSSDIHAFRRGELDQAERIWKSLLRCYEESGDELWAGRILRRLGDIRFERKQWAEAADCYRRAVEILDRLGVLPVARFLAKYQLASALDRWLFEHSPGGQPAHDDARLTEAIRELEGAIQIVIRATAATTGGEVHWDTFRAHFACAPDLLIRLLLRQGDPVRALYHCEEFGRRLGPALLQVSGVELLGTAPPKLVEELRSLQQKREELERQIRQRTAEPNAYEQVRRLESQIRTKWIEIVDANTSLRRVLEAATPFEQFGSAIAVLQSLNNASVLYYSLRSETSYVWLITPKAIRHYELKLSKKNAALLHLTTEAFTEPGAQQVIAGFIRDISRPPKPGQVKRGVKEVPGREIPLPPEDASALEQRGQALFEILLPAEIRNPLRDFKRIVIVPDGILHGLPFQALIVGADNQGPLYVLDQFPPISYAPSLKALAILQARESRQEAQKTRALVMASEHLKDAPRECRMVQQRIGSLLPTTALIGAAASEKAFKSDASQYGLILIIAHAVYTGELDNFLGFVLLSRPVGNEDGRLEIPEIYQLRLNGCTVVLGACQTAVGSKRYLEAGNSLARAFLVGGATRVVASHWKVDDQATYHLMSNFYEEVAEAIKNNQPVDYAGALHLAMRRMRGDPKWRPPYYWAAFTVTGPPVAGARLEAPVRSGRN